VTAVFIITAVVLIVIGGLLTALDGALHVLSRNDLLDEAEGAKRRRALQSVATDVAAHVTALAFVRVIVDAIAAVLITLALTRLLDEWWQVLLVASVIVIAVFFVVVGSSPRSVGMTHPRPMVRRFAPLIRAIRIVLGPLAEGLIVVGRIVTPGRPGGGPLASEEQLRSLVDEAAHQDVLEAEDRELLHSVFEFGDTIVREVMVARTDMVTADSDDSLKEALGRFLEQGVSRMPVVGKDSDDIVGVVYLKDVARAQLESPRTMTRSTVAGLAKPALFVPETKKADDTLRYLQSEQNHMALVVDEYGGIAGLVTMEDLMEELVGEITDEYDNGDAGVAELGEDRYRFSVRFPLDDMADLFDMDIDEEDVDTVGGLMTVSLGRLPQAGSQTEIHGLMMTADPPASSKAPVTTVVVEPTPGLRRQLRERRALEGTLTGEIPLP
jgi:CBS domain containing-hemolysin-like protein